MLLHHFVNRVLLLCGLVSLTVAAMASEYHGQVVFSGLPLPGSTVTVTATQGDKKVVAISDEQGLFSFTDLADGKWSLTIEMTGFAPLKQEITVLPAPAVPAPAEATTSGGAAAVGTFELKLLSLDQIRAQDKPVKVETIQLATAAAAPAITATVVAPAPAGTPAAGAAATGNGGSAKTPAAVAPPPPPPEAPAQAANDGYLINGSVNNASTSQFSQNAAFGNSRHGRSLYNTQAFLRLDNSALDATPFSVTGAPEPRPQFNNYTFRIDFGGPLNIKHLMPRGPYFGVNYSHTQNSAFNTQAALIPTGQDATGNWNLSSSSVTSISVPADLATVAPTCDGYLTGHGISQAQIAAGTAVFANNIIPAQCVTSASTALLKLYPQSPNLSGNPQYNYQLPLDTSSSSDTVGLSLNRQFGNKDSVYGRWNFSDSRGNTPSIFGFLDTNATLSSDTSINWGHRFTQRLYGNLSYSFSRSRSQVVPNFANKNNIQATAGITGASTTPAFWGPPSLSFSSGLLGLSDQVFSYDRNETNGLDATVNWNHLSHNLKFGGGFGRRQFNYQTQSNPYGQLSFSGASTRSATGTGGSDLADLLLGIPDTSSIAYGNADKYLRQSTYNLFVNDDFRVNPELSVTAGLRWEYGAPVTELKGRLVNLDLTPGFAQETPVLGTNPKGSLTGRSYPSSLVHPDYSRPEPSVGIAWRPISGSSLLIRSGYGVANDTSVYQSAAYAMAQQAPLSTSLSISNSVACPFNIFNPFTAPSCSTTSPDSFALDPDFKVGYVQSWKLEVQRDLPFSLQTVVTYLGIKGTRGVQEILPNSCPPPASGVSAPCTTATSGYIYRTSNGNLTRHAGTIELRRRLRNGFTARMLYTFAKSLDDDYSLSGQGGVATTSGIAQDWTNPAGQRGLSTTDQRHLLTVTAQYTTGMGLGGKTLLSGWRGAIYKEWTIQTAITAGSGLPQTPIYFGATTAGTGINGAIRPNVVSPPNAGLQAGYFVNANAYAAPLGSYGNARRDSIEGPGQFSMSAGMLRTFRLHDRYTLDAQLNATNVLNHVTYTGWNTAWIPGSTTFGAPQNANQMRSVSLQLRMRF